MTRSQREANWQGMNWIRQEKRLAIYMRDGLACAYCSEGVEEGVRLTLDHVIPVEKGGSNNSDNLITCCDRCNGAKGERHVAEFIRATAAYLNHEVRAIDIQCHVLDCLARLLPLDQAKVQIAKRGSAAKAVRAMRRYNECEDADCSPAGPVD